MMHVPITCLEKPSRDVIFPVDRDVKSELYC